MDKSISKHIAQLYGLDGDWDEVIFTCFNPTRNDRRIDLFNPILAYQTDIPDAPPLFYITGSADYNYSVRDFFYAPAWVRRIYVYSRTKENFEQVITHVYKDANGVECQMPRIASLSVGVNQFQGWIGELDFPNKECVFGINQWFQDVLIKSRSNLTFLLIYKQIDKSLLLASSSAYGSSTLCDEITSCVHSPKQWSEDDLELNDYLYASPYKQNMYAGQQTAAVMPFDFSILKEYSGVDVEK
jgi:hypothetical protein